MQSVAVNHRWRYAQKSDDRASPLIRFLDSDLLLQSRLLNRKPLCRRLSAGVLGAGRAPPQRRALINSGGAFLANGTHCNNIEVVYNE